MTKMRNHFLVLLKHGYKNNASVWNGWIDELNNAGIYAETVTSGEVLIKTSANSHLIDTFRTYIVWTSTRSPFYGNNCKAYSPLLIQLLVMISCFLYLYMVPRYLYFCKLCIKTFNTYTNITV